MKIADIQGNIRKLYQNERVYIFLDMDVRQEVSKKIWDRVYTLITSNIIHPIQALYGTGKS